MSMNDLNIKIEFFDSKDMFIKYLEHEGFGEQNQDIIFENLEGVVWSKTKDGQIAFYPDVFKTLQDYSLMFDR